MRILYTFLGYLSYPAKATMSPDLDYSAACMGHEAWLHPSKVQETHLVNKPQSPINKIPQHPPDLHGDFPQMEKIKDIFSALLSTHLSFLLPPHLLQLQGSSTIGPIM